MSSEQRLQKVIAASGYTSRRKAEQLILDKRVKVNGNVVSELGTKVSSKDIIHIDGKRISEEKKVYYIINKPKNVLSSVSDDRNRKVIVDLIKEKRRIYPVGRLDYDTTGLLLLTNDGEFTNAITHPSFEIDKQYQVLVDCFISETMKKKLERGIILGDYKTLPAKVVVENFDRENKQASVLITIREGKNRQVKRMFEAVGCKVISLNRKKVGFLTLEGLNIGEYRQLTRLEINKLMNLAKTGVIEW